MQALLERPAVDDTPQLAAQTAEAVADVLKTATPPAPPQLGMTHLGLSFCALSMQGLLGVPGTGEPDVMAEFAFDGPIAATEIAAFLDWSAERITRFGWVQKTTQFQEFTCATGAMGVRRRELHGRMHPGRAEILAATARHRLWAYLTRVTRSQFGSIEEWNDFPGRTKEEVVALFREAAEHLRRNGEPCRYPYFDPLIA